MAFWSMIPMISSEPTERGFGRMFSCVSKIALGCGN